jgi:RNA recognition motif
MNPFEQYGPASFDRIFVGGVPRGTTEPELRRAFAVAGADVGTIEFVIDRVTGIQRGFAFVGLLGRMHTSADALAIERLRSTTLDGCTLDIQGVPDRRVRRFA